MQTPIGRSVPRVEGLARTTGSALYVDDLRISGMLHGRTIRSTIPCGHLDGAHLLSDPAGFIAVDWRDIRGSNRVAVGAGDQPFLVEREIRHAAEPVMLLAHADKEALLQAEVMLRETAGVPVLDPECSPTAFDVREIVVGDPSAGLEAAELVLEGTYRCGAQEHAYIETNGIIAIPSDGGIVVHGSMQCPFYVHHALVALLGDTVRFVRVVPAETGGGFGGKEDYPSLLAGHAALLALKAQRPVKLVYDRAEDMLATTKRHPAIIRHRTGVARDGRLVSMDVDVTLDAGAYATLSPLVLMRAILHAGGPYRCPNVRLRGRAMRTNTPPNGAFRGFGATQTQFAVEVHLDRIAERLGMDPVLLRERNVLLPGDTTVTGQRLGSDAAGLTVLRTAVQRSRYRRKRREWRGTRRGIGVALYWHGAGLAGRAEAAIASRITLELLPDGARLLTSCTDFGQGTTTMLAQIAAASLGLPVDRVYVAPVDTTVVPDSGPTVASRTCMIVGRLVQLAAEEIRQRLGGLSAEDYCRQHGLLRVTKQYEFPGDRTWDDASCRGDAYATYSWGCDVAEVELDPDTWEVHPRRITAVADVGRVIHPAMARGQIEGGTAQGTGYALLEQVVMRDGRMVNSHFADYSIPTTLDAPAMDVVLLETPYEGGPFGAKGLGELPMHGPAPAILNAARHLGLDLRELPALPEKVMEASCASK